MISTVSFSFDLTSAVPRCVITDSTDYTGLGIDVAANQAKGYGVLTFNGEVIEAKNIPGNPLIDLEFGQTIGYLDLPLDVNGNVANGVYSFEYSLRLNGVNYQILTIPSSNILVGDGNGWLSNFLESGNEIELVSSSIYTHTVASATNVGGNARIVTSTNILGGITYDSYQFDIANVQFSGTYTYSGCTQTNADVDFVYDCEYGDSGTWSVSNATALGSNEIVTSLSCTINYPSWTTSNPLFNPQVVTTVLPYPTYPSPTPPVTTPLATGTYTVSLSEQIQQTQSSGLVVIYNKSVIKEFTVSCAGTLCGLVPCIENLRAAHAAELIRNKVSKYQVYVDNVALYYLEAMNYKACGELDKYKSTIDLLQAQLDASGCDCACCDDESYYWVSNNSANSIIDELLANFQYRLYVGGGSDPGDTQPGVEYGAIWQDTDTGIFYRCINDAPGGLQWEVYYDPNGTIPATRITATPNAQFSSTNVQGQLTEIANEAVFGASNGLTKSGSNVKLGGTITEITTITAGPQVLGVTATTGFVSISKTGTGFPALAVTGVSRSFAASASDEQAGLFVVNRLITDNTVARNLTVQTTTFGGSGVAGNGFGASIDFVLSNSVGADVVTSSIKSSWLGAAGQNSRLDLTTAAAGIESTQLSILTNGDLVLDKYGDGNKIAAVAYNLGVASNGVIVESEFPIYSLIVLKVTQSASGVAITPIVNTTKNPVTGANIVSRPGEFTLSQIDIVASKTSVLVQNGSAPGVVPKVGFVYAEAGAGKINFTTYNTSNPIDLADGILNNAIVEIKIFP